MIPLASTLSASAPALAAAKPTCQGQVATIVGKHPGRLKGTSGPDVIVGSAGVDKIKGRGGDDRICGLGGKDKINGGPGNDDLDGGADKDKVNGGPGTDACVAEPGHDKLKSCNEPVTPPPPPVDESPQAVADAATVAEDAAATAVNVLANDTDIDGGPKSISSVTQPSHGTVAITGGGTGLTYKPTANYCNGGSPLDTFTYTLTPGGSTATVSMTVTCVDDPPAAVNDASTVAEDAAATAVNVLANDTDIDGGPKSISSVTQPSHGTVAITGGGTGLTYKPTANYCNGGSPLDTFTYTLTPGGSTATVSMTVTCVDDPPAAVNDASTVAEDAAATAVNVLANDTDIDGGPKSISSVTQPSHGTVAITGGGSGLTYKPTANYCNGGSPLDTFTYTLTPGGSTATVSMTVTCVDDPPVAVNDASTVAEDAAATAVNVLANDTDVDGGTAKSIASVTQPAHGTVAITGGGTGLTYKPTANYCNGGSPLDTFTYTLTPGGSTATVSMTVTCVDDSPVAVNDSATVTQDAAATAIGVLANDTDIDAGPKSISSVAQPSHGTVAITGGGTGLTYKPTASYCNDGSPLDTFTYSLSPGGSTATVSMTVTCPSTVPTAPISYTPGTALHVQDTGVDYWVYVPSSYDSTHHTPTTLFVWLHGCGGASQDDVLNVSPGGSGQNWISIGLGGREGACWQPGSDDAKVLAAIAAVKTHFNIAPRSVVIGGFSSGGDLAYRVAFLHPASFAGLLAVNTSPFKGSGVTQAQVMAAAASPFHIVHLAHLQDTLYPIAEVRTDTDAAKAAGFDLTRVEREGNTYDGAGAVVNGHPVPGTYADISTYLLPHLHDGWQSAG